MRRTMVRWTIAGLIVVAIAVSGLTAAGAFTTTTNVKVVHVVVASPVPTPARTAPASRPATPADTMPPASAGSNGSFTPPATSGSPLRPGAAASFGRLQATLPGPVDVALAPLGSSSTVLLGQDTPAHGWSTTKVPVLVALLRARGDQGLTATQQAWARLAITQSDNQSILNLFGDLETIEGGLGRASDYVGQLFRQSGDTQTVVATAPPPPGGVTTFGQTEWAPTEASKFFRALGDGCLLSKSESDSVIQLMEQIEPSESWGLGSGGFNVPVAFKGGWGPEPSGSYLVRQSGIIDAGSPHAVAVSIVALPPGSNSFGVGTDMLTRTAQWLRDQLLLPANGSTTCSTG
jgi:hypothetical protein